MCAHGSSVHQKRSKYALINLLFGLCKSKWIIDLLITRPSPHPGALAHPFTFEMLQIKEHIPTPSFNVFTFELTFESYEKFRGASQNVGDIDF